MFNFDTKTENRESKLSYSDMLAHDAFRYGGGLNKSAARIYWLLLQQTLRTTEIANTTGISRRNVYRLLRKMQKIVNSHTGEIISMVDRQGNRWFAIEVDLDMVALVIGTKGIGKKQRERHSKERRAHNKLFRPIKKK